MQLTTTAFRLRQAHADDLPAINGVIERAIATWQLPERVKRLSLPSYRYHAHDLVHLHLVVAEDAGHALVGVAAWEPARQRDLPAGMSGLLLHGLYVDPVHQHRGVGSRLLDAAAEAARAQGLAGVLVKSQADASGFFEARGLQRIPVEDPARDYPHRFWLAASH
ncbi:MAG: GNAT family N-acetyltransferase [Thiobacillus sp. GWE1_62_9]|nr:MAG: GNAT family N-acetyltransferase [Thiobacillus sp. GWE1_62_9]